MENSFYYSKIVKGVFKYGNYPWQFVYIVLASSNVRLYARLKDTQSRDTRKVILGLCNAS